MMDKDDLKSAVGYLRCSTDKQDYSIGDQKKVILQKAPQLGYRVTDWFIDRGKSGRSVYRRDAFQRLIKAIEKKSNTFSAVLVYDISRWGRFEDADESAYWEYHCKRYGVDVIYVEEEFRNDTSLETFILKAVRRSSAGEYSKNLSKLTRRGSKTNASLGFSCGGSPPYGYDRLLVTSTGEPVRVLKPGEHKAEKNQRVKLVPGNPQEVSNVKFIFDSYVNKRGLRTIASLFNDKSIPSPRGGNWKSSTIRNILSNEAYCGTRIYYRTDHTERKKTGVGSPKMHDESEWVRTEGAHEPIISKELFKKVRQQMVTYTRQDIEQRLHSDYLLLGLIRCMNCQHNYQGHAHVSKKTTKTGKVTVCKTRYYQCGGLMSGGKAVCPGVHIYAPEIEDITVNALRETIRGTQEIIDGVREILKARLSAIYKESPNELRYIEKAFADNERKMDNIMRGVEQGIDIEIAKRNIDKLKSEQYRLQMRKDELKSLENDNSIDVDLLCEELVSYIDEFDKMYEKGTIVEKKLLIRSSLNKPIEVYPDIPQAALYINKIPRSTRAHQFLFPEKKVEVETMAGVGFEPTAFRLWA